LLLLGLASIAFASSRWYARRNELR
jgi:hypothetical protein